jgi:uncharacterized membrane protein (UPF0136 family)
MKPTVILWVYILLLLLGGGMGYYKGKSKISLYVSLVFAMALSLCASGILAWPWADGLLGLLLLVFAVRLVKTKKFMPSGLMLSLTLLALALGHLAK